MKHYLHQLIVICAILLTSSITSLAGNIPQYIYERSTSLYSKITGGTEVTSKWETCSLIFADGTETNNEYTGQGFEIGFDFKFGGQMFNQFAICNNGLLYFGKNAVSFNGRPSFYFAEIQQGQDSDKPNSAYYNTFYAGIAPIAYGIKSGNISFKAEGEIGKRVCTVQFANMILNETGTSRGKYSAQIRIYEENNKIEMALEEIETCYGSLGGFYVGIRGYNDDDTMLLTGTGIAAKDIAVSAIRTASMIDSGTYINWDEEDYDKFYKSAFAFTPENNTTVPANAPTDIKIAEKNGELFITCNKAEGAKATVLLYSSSPITEEDLPTDGETFDRGKTFGNSTILYYGDREIISASLSKELVKPQTTYYISALSANGIPMFNRTHTAQVSYSTTQAAPETFKVSTLGISALKLEWNSSYPVIIAVSDQHPETSDSGYIGVFGQPTADLSEGDEIPEGGKIIYKGDASEFSFENCKANRLYYFKIWTVDEGIVSSAGKDAFGIPTPSLSYEPELENYPQGTVPSGWTCEVTDFKPAIRDYDGAHVLRATNDGDTVVIKASRLISPELPLDCASKLSFEYALETIAPGAGKDSKGYIPGVFGDEGGLTVSAGEITGKEQELKTVHTYNGTMVAAGGDGEGYNTGSSTFETVTVDLPKLTATSRICFSFSANKFSQLFLRNISIVATGTGVDEQQSDIPQTKIHGGKGIIYIFPATNGILNLYSMDGRKVRTVKVEKEIAVSLPVQAGIYIMNNQKVVIK